MKKLLFSVSAIAIFLTACGDRALTVKEASPTELSSGKKVSAAKLDGWKFDAKAEVKTDSLTGKKWDVTTKNASIYPVGFWSTVGVTTLPAISIRISSTMDSRNPEKAITYVNLFPGLAGAIGSADCLEECTIRVLPDDGTPLYVKAHGAPSTNGSGEPSRFLTVDDAEKFIAIIKSSRRLKIEFPYLPNAKTSISKSEMKISEFDVSGFSL